MIIKYNVTLKCFENYKKLAVEASKMYKNKQLKKSRFPISFLEPEMHLLDNSVSGSLARMQHARRPDQVLGLGGHHGGQRPQHDKKRVEPFPFGCDVIVITDCENGQVSWHFLIYFIKKFENLRRYQLWKGFHGWFLEIWILLELWHLEV